MKFSLNLKNQLKSKKKQKNLQENAVTGVPGQSGGLICVRWTVPGRGSSWKSAKPPTPKLCVAGPPPLRRSGEHRGGEGGEQDGAGAAVPLGSGAG